LVTSRRTDQGGQTIEYWLWRGDGFSYHAIDDKSLPPVSWGHFWFSTVWEHKSGDVWMAIPERDP
jgi:hypothetical protein